MALASIKKLLPLATAGISGIAAGYFLPPNVFAGVTQELIALFGLMIAAVLPAMTLTATALRSGSLSRNRLGRLYFALRQQLMVWLGMFVLALLLCGAVVVGKITNWELTAVLPIGEGFSFNFCRVLVGAISFGAVLFVARVGAVGRGVLSILDVSREVAMSEAAEAEEAQNKKLRTAVNEMQEPPGRGSYVDLPH